MSGEKGPWWKDPRFLIPSILVPVALALVPFMRGERVSAELAVTVVLRDARRDTPSAFDISLRREFAASASSGAEMAAAIADTLAAEAGASIRQVAPERKPIRAIIEQHADGTLSVDRSLGDRVALHISRFEGARSIGDVVPDPMVQHTLDTAPNLGTEDPHDGLQLRAGVYRLIVTVPGCRDAWTFLELTPDGALLAGRSSDAVRPARFPLALQVMPRSQGTLRVAIEPCMSVSPATARPRFQELGDAIAGSFAASLNRLDGFDAVLLRHGERVGFDLNVSKNQPPPDGLVPADLVMTQCRVEWLE